MSRGAINFSSNDEYFTPKWLVDRFGKFDYDPATTREKSEELGIKNYDTVETDGLKSDWAKYRRIWVNPPFTLKNEFLKKAQEYYRATGGDIYILLPISYLTTKKFHEICGGGRIYVPNGRIKFENGVGGDVRSLAFGSIVLKLDNKWSVQTITI
jgi:phage N-6-adenine-methyltransferase